MRYSAFLLLTAVAAQAQNAPPAFRSDAQLVIVDTQVRERATGRVIDLLSARDFVILDQGEEREIKIFEIGTTPLDVVFLLYADGVLQLRDDGNILRRGLRGALAELRQNDRAAVLRQHSGKADVPLTSNLGSVEAALLTMGRLSPLGRGGRLYDAVLTAVDVFPQPYDRGRRRAIVAITDDIERASKMKSPGLLEEILEADATLNGGLIVTSQPYATVNAGTIPIPGIPNRTSHRIGPGNRSGDSIQSLVDDSGGELIPGDKFAAEFPEMLRRIRGRFLLGFYAPKATTREFRRIEVKLTKAAEAKFPDAIIRARRGYYTERESAMGKSIR